MSRNTFLYIFICAIVSCMSACDKNAHEKELYGISVRLTFDDELDASQTKVKNGSLWIYQVDGKLVKEYFYEGAKDLSSQCFDLPAGNYVVVSALNFNSPLTYKNQNEMQALAFYTSAPEPLSEHAFSRTDQVEVSENENQLVTLPMKRVFSELAIKIEGVPSGARLNTKVYEPAEGILPACKDADGQYGLPTTETMTEVILPESLEKNGAIVTEAMRVMPTAQGKSGSRLGLFLTTTDGVTFECVVDAPRMKPAGKYELTLSYNELKPYLRVSAIKITDWKYGWTISGEILDPNN